jgi:lysophospholipase L1-like esterase
MNIRTLLAVCLLASARISAEAATAVMPLGDSGTLGAYSANDFGIGGYRAPLWLRLTQEGYAVDFVGSVNGPAPAGVDPDHEGHGGWRIDDIADSIDGWLANSRPDIILLMAGANDIIQGHGVGTAMSRMDTLLGKIFTDRPNAVVLLASLWWVPKPNFYNYDIKQIQAMNSRLPPLVAKYAQQGWAIELVDQYNLGWVATDFGADQIHPNATGYAKIAQAWHDPLARRLVATPPYTPPPTGTFYRRVNLGGGAVTTDGHVWDAGNATNVTATGGTFAAASVVLNPPTNAARASMIHDSAYDFSGSNVALTAVPAGTYDVYVWEDNSSETVDILLDDAVVRAGYATGNAGHWDRRGPFASSAPGGRIAVTTRGGVAHLSGIEVWKTGGM